MLPAYYAQAEKGVIRFQISSSCRAFYGMLLHSMVHIAVVFSWTCLGLDSPCGMVLYSITHHGIKPEIGVNRKWLRHMLIGWHGAAG
jgi:hypothetical protein